MTDIEDSGRRRVAGTERSGRVISLRTNPTRRHNALVWMLIGLVVVLSALLAAATWYLLFRPQTDLAPGAPVQVEIPVGSSTADIAAMLADAGVVRNANMFRLQARLTASDSELKAGIYDLTTGMHYDEVIVALSNGPEVQYVKVTIPEGFVIEQIAERFEQEAGVSAEEFVSLAKTGGALEFPDHPYLASGYQGSLEGYLFPKTYMVEKGAAARDVIESMLDQFDEEITQVDTATPASRGIDLHELVTIASIIEREAKVSEERPLVSSVIYNRLEKGMRLEIDATLEYFLPGNTFRLNLEDLRTESPYNTYLNEGLPPGPIASPGLAALEAAASPAETDYLYYVLTSKDGSHTFTTNVEDFLKAKERSKEVFGE